MLRNANQTITREFASAKAGGGSASILPETSLGARVADDYSLDRVIGRGSAATVYSAVHAPSGERVAIKLLHGTAPQALHARARFMREARASAIIHHPNIVHLIESGSDREGRLYQIFELLEGRDLGEALEGGPLDLVTTLEVGRQLLAGLEAVHRRGYLHRDVKPENVFLCDEGDGLLRVKLLDFGVARDMDDTIPRITSDEALLGSPAFTSPEQVTDELPTTERSDLWSVGAILFTCLAGRPPFNDRNLSSMMVRIAREPAPSIARFRREVPEALARVIARALRTHPAHRYSSAREMEEALSQIN